MNSPLRILIIEDESLTALTIEENLTEAGYEICGKATDYDSAIQLMIKESPDLALVDIYLGENKTDGIVTAHELVRIKPIPIIYLTAKTEPETFKRAKKTMPLAYLHKPFRPAELAMQIELALHNFYQGNIPEVVAMSDHLFVPDGPNKLLRINHDGIHYINADGPYTEFYLSQKELLRLYPEKNLQPKKPLLMSVGFGHLLNNLPENFCKISRSVAINLDYLDRIENNHIIVGGCEVALPDGGHKLLVERLNVIRSRKKK